MYTPRVATTLPQTTKQAASQILRAAKGYTAPCTVTSLRLCCTPSYQHQYFSSPRQFSTTSRTRLREYFPEPDSPHIKKTEASWRHPEYTEEQMKKNIVVAHREARDWTDKFALAMVKFFRWGTNVATGYKHDVEEPKAASDANAVELTKPYVCAYFSLQSLSSIRKYAD